MTIFVIVPVARRNAIFRGLFSEREPNRFKFHGIANGGTNNFHFGTVRIKPSVAQALPK